jgi:hypothetical protein
MSARRDEDGPYAGGPVVEAQLGDREDAVERAAGDDRSDVAGVERGLARLGDAAAADERVSRRRAGRRVPPKLIVRRRIFALAAFGILVLIGWLLVDTLAGSGTPTDYQGTWLTSSNLLGSPKLVITNHSGIWAMTGLDVFGKPDKTVALSSGRLVATGTSTNGRWRLELQLLDDDHQLIATLSAAGSAPQIDRYTRQ